AAPGAGAPAPVPARRSRQSSGRRSGAPGRAAGRDGAADAGAPRRAEGRPQRSVSVRLGQEIQALPRPADLIQDEPVHVVARVIRDAPGRVLVADRPVGRHLAGFWEFPGGKSDPGEAPLDALRRELAEELGIRVESAEPLISVPWMYPEKRIVLDAWI